MKILPFLELPVAVESEAVIRAHLEACFLNHVPVLLAPVTTGNLLLAIFPFYRKRYAGMSFVYPATRFSAWCFQRLHRNSDKTGKTKTRTAPKARPSSSATASAPAVKITRAMKKVERREAKIYGHRLFFDLLETAFSTQHSVFFLGLTDNQKYNLQRKLRYCFNTLSDICYVSYPHTRYRPEETINLITRSQKKVFSATSAPPSSSSPPHSPLTSEQNRYSLVVADPKVRKVRGLYDRLVSECTNGMVFFDANFLGRYEHNWLWGIGLSRSKKRNFGKWLLDTPAHGGKLLLRTLKLTGAVLLTLGKILLGIITLYYPVLFGFSLGLFMIGLLRKPKLHELFTPPLPKQTEKTEQTDSDEPV